MVHVSIPSDAKKFIYISLIPLFFFLSGIFSKKQADYPAFFKKKCLRLLIPYLTFNIITYLFWLLIGRHFGDDANDSTAFWQPLLGVIYGSGHAIIHYVPLWFLPCIFMTENLYFLIQKYSKSQKIKIIFIVCCGILGWINYRFNPYLLPWGAGSALVMVVFYGFGDIVGNKIFINTANSIKNNALLFVICLISMIFVYFWLPINKQIEVVDNMYGNYIFFLVGASVGVVGIIAFCKLFENISVPLKPLIFAGQNTLIILGFHLITMSLVKAITFFIFRLPLSIFDQTFAAITLAFCSIIICMPIIYIIKKYFPFLIDKREHLKTQKLRLATDEKAEFTNVNEHFEEGA